MVWDVTVVLMFLISFWIGWSMRIYLNLIRVVLVALFAAALIFLIPYFITFVEHSSVNWPTYAYYILGFGFILLIFLGFYLFLGARGSSLSGVRRLTGSLVVAGLFTYAWVIVLTSLGENGWIEVADSAILTILPDWLLYPVN